MDYVSKLNKIIEQNLLTDHFDGGKELTALLDAAVKLYDVVNYLLIYNSNLKNNIILPDEMVRLGKNISYLKNKLGLNEKQENAITR